MPNFDWDLVVVGGGAAGYFCAIQAAEAKPGLRIAILEKSPKTLGKVKISGGGRCNVTNAEERNKVFLEAYPRGQAFLKKGFQQFGPKQTRAWFESAGMPLKAEADGRMFPQENRSEAVLRLFDRKIQSLSIQVLCKHSLERLEVLETGFSLQVLAEGEPRCWLSRQVVLAMGGIHKESVWEPLQTLGLARISSVPSLFTFQIPDARLHALSGLSLPQSRVWLQGDKRRFDGPLLFTHWGLSGPSILKASAHLARELAELNYNFAIRVNFLGAEAHESSAWETMASHATAHADKQMKNAVPLGLPQRFFLFSLEMLGFDPESRWRDFGASKQRKWADWMLNASFQCQGKTTFKEEFVTAGGLDLNEINEHCGLRRYPGLWAIGELLDIDGVTGGYNFQAAWTTAWLAAQGIAAFAKPD